MSDENPKRPITPEAIEDRGANTSCNPTLGEIIALRLSRRDVVRGLLATSAIAAAVEPLGLAASAWAQEAAAAGVPGFEFAELAAGSDETHHVAQGYDADVLIRWGDPVLANAPAFDPAQQTADRQAAQFGYNNDFIGFLPLDGSGRRGLLVVNHEYSNDELMFPGLGEIKSRMDVVERMTPAQVGIAMAAHGGSVIEVARGAGGKWAVVADSKYARRIDATTPMRVSGPAAGHARMKTTADPAGTSIKGMLNNCAGGLTPWGTWLTCEENFNFYFQNKDAAAKLPDAAALKRYGVPSRWYTWGNVDKRFDLGAERNEANRFGWVVEIDPFDPTSVPVKRTALGRFKHEGAAGTFAKDGRWVIYQGDDEAFDYVYKFVTAATVDIANKAANRDILDQGTLYVARFNADGTGEWMPLVHGQGGLTVENGFADQGDVLIHARLAADKLGATKMDRPEDVEANEKTGKVYVILTLNKSRKEGETDKANPRPKNLFGHIIELTPEGGDHAATRFTWDMLLKCGDPSVAAVGATFNAATSASGWFGMPDNCAVDALGRLWVTTDGNTKSRTGRTDGVWALETEGKGRGTGRLFFRVPVGAEMCGPAFTPDLETLFVAVQHPGETESEAPDAPLSTFDKPITRWPDFDPKLPPRPSVVAITRKGGGKIGV